MTLSKTLLAGSAIAAILLAAPAAAQDAHAHAAPAAGVADIVRDAADLPGPLARRGPETVKVDLETTEVTGQLADGSTYHYWTFNGKVPGPFVRVRVGDTVEVRMKNSDHSQVPHNVDFHAVTGPGGGAGTEDEERQGRESSHGAWSSPAAAAGTAVTRVLMPGSRASPWPSVSAMSTTK